MAAPDRYRYDPLLPEGQIRLLHLKSGNECAPIEISILSTALDDQPLYEALSYTWGDPSKTVAIICNGNEDTLQVTLNCEAALRRLRLKDSERVLWVDAICIDQSNVQERNQQVRIMSTIYQQAQRVIAYLGEGSEETNLGMDFIAEDASSMDGSAVYGTNRPSVGLALGITSSPQQRAMDRILERPYFERMWILQEIVFAREIIMVLGDRMVDWRAFSTTVFYVEANKKIHLQARYPKNPPKAVFYRDEATNFSNSERSNTDQPGSLLAFLKDTRHLKCSDPRDNVYALLGMTPEKEHIIPNYNIPTRDLFIYLAKFFIARDKNLDVLCHVHGTHSTHNLPSWVPDWSYSRQAEVLGHEKTVSARPYKSALQTSAKVIFDQDPDVLIAEGVPVDIVSQVGSMYDMADEESTSTLRQWESIMNCTTSSRTEANAAAANFIDTLIAYPTYQVSNPFVRFYPAWHKITLSAQASDTLTIADANPAAIFREQLNKVCHGRCFFVTKGGRMGLGSPEMREGDELAVFLGGSVPFVLHAENEERFRLLGECYLHGFMNGEALGGPEIEKKRMFRII